MHVDIPLLCFCGYIAVMFSHMFEFYLNWHCDIHAKQWSNPETHVTVWLDLKHIYRGPLLTRFNFNPSMDKKSYAQ